MAEKNGRMQLIGGNGRFNVTEFENLWKKVKISYVVSIMGPQSSGKSTLLNHLFNTNFAEMNDSKGRKQTTKGIWVARYAGFKHHTQHHTLVMDMEGSDSSARGENDNFEKWSALFALAISDIVLINMWDHDIGRNHAASKPLLETVFQYMLCRPRKVTLMFVIRDQAKTSLEVLTELIQKDMKKIWNSIDSPIVRKGTPLKEFFNVKVEALCHYEHKKDQFKKEVAGLKMKICGVDRDQRNVVPASRFSKNAQKIWKEIKDNKDLDIPSMKVLVANFRCDEIANKKFERFKRYYKAKKDAKKWFTQCVSEYDEETQYYDKVVRYGKRKELEAKLLLQLLEAKGFNWKKEKKKKSAMWALSVAAVLTTLGIAVALATPGLQGMAISMIPAIAGIAGEFAALHRGQNKERK